MGTRLVNTERATGIASRRAAQDRFARAAPWAVAAGLGIGALATASGRAFGLGSADWVVAAGGAALGLIAAGGIAARAAWSARRAARELDRRANLKDTLGSAMELAAAPPGDPFVRTILADAEASAARVDVARLVPVRARAGEWGWAALALGACIAATWVPPITRPAPNQKPAIAKAEAVASVQQARRAIEAVRPGAADASRELAALEALERELAEGKTGSVDAVAKAAEQVERAAERAESKAAELQSSVDRVRTLLAASPDEKPTSELGRALGDGDTEAAAKAAAALRENLKRMNPAERERVARELAEIAERLESGESPSPGHRPEGSSPDAGAESAAPGDSGPEVPGTDGAESPGSRPTPGASTTPADEIRKALREASEQLRSQDSPSAAPPPPENAGAEPGPESDAGSPKADEPKRDPGAPSGPARQPSPRSGADRGAPAEKSDQGTQGEKQGAGSQGSQRPGEVSKPAEGQPSGTDTKAGSQTNGKPQAKSDQTSGDKPSAEPKSPQGQPGQTPKAQPQGSSDPNAKGQPRSSGSPPAGEQSKPTAPTSEKGQGMPNSTPSAPGATNPPTTKPDTSTPGTTNPKPTDPGTAKPEASKPEPGKADPANQEQQPQTGETAPQPGAAGPKPSEPRPQDPPRSQGQPKQDGQPTPRDGVSPGAERQPAGEQKSGGEPAPAAEPAPAGSKPDASDSKSAPSGAPKRSPGTDAPREGKDPSTPDGPQDPAGEPRPGETPAPGAGEQPGQDPTQAPTPRDAIKGLEEALKRTGELQKLAERQRSDAKDLRKQAEEILKNASPEERQRLMELAQRLASKMQGQGPKQPDAGPGLPGEGSLAGGDARGPGVPPQQAPVRTAPDATEAVDARQQTPTGERVIAKWFDPNSPNGAGISREAIREDVRQAAAGAERAIEQQVVPGRHSDLIRRVFRRYAERTEPAARPAPVEAAPDAPAKGGSGSP